MIEKLAVSCGRLIGRYSRTNVTDANVRQVRDTPFPDRAGIWIGWHEANLITIALHRFIVGRPATAFILPGLSGRVVRGWLEALQVTPVMLFSDLRVGLVLQHMKEALRSGVDVLIAVDGPKGPRHRVKAGALWLASQSGAPILPVGCAAARAWHVPRWDRLVVPLPGTAIVAVFGSEIALPRGTPLSVAAAQIESTLHSLTARAHAALAEPAWERAGMANEPVGRRQWR